MELVNVPIPMDIIKDERRKEDRVPDDDPIVIDGRRCRIDPRKTEVSVAVQADEVELRFEDNSNDEFWMHVRIPRARLEEWVKQVHEASDARWDARRRKNESDSG